MKNGSLKRIFVLFLLLALTVSAVSPAFAKVGTVYKVGVKGLHLHSASTGSSSPSDKIVASLSKGTKVLHVATAKNWWKVRTASGKVGYVYKTYLTPVGSSSSLITGKKGTVNCASLRVHKKASTSSKVIATLSKGKKVKVIAAKGSWAKIKTSAGYGFIKWSYLKF